MAIYSRAQSRQELCRLLKSGMDTADQDWVLPYQQTDFGGASPVVQVTSGGSDRPRMVLKGAAKTGFWLAIEIFVIQTADGWTAEDAENQIDQLEMEAAKVIHENKSNEGFWRSIGYEGRSIIDRVTISGENYLWEVIPIKVEAW